MMKFLCFLFIAWLPATFVSGASTVKLTAPVCDDPIFSYFKKEYTIKCRAEQVSNDPTPECQLYYQGDGAPFYYYVDYRSTPACCGSDLIDLVCTFTIDAQDLTCGVEYSFTVTATSDDGSLSKGSEEYTSPVTYGEFGSCPKVELTTPICNDPVLNNEQEAFTMECRAADVSQYPRPHCDLYHQGEETPVAYKRDYSYTPACCGLMTMSCNITINARNFTCGVEYTFAVAATMYDGKLSSDISDYSSPVTYGELGNCPKAPVGSTTSAVTSTRAHQTTVRSTPPAVTSDKDGKTTESTPAVTTTRALATTVRTTQSTVTTDKDGKITELIPFDIFTRPSPTKPTGPFCDDPVLNATTKVFIMKCRAENVTLDRMPKCNVLYEGDGSPIPYDVDYGFTPACCVFDLYIMSCNIIMRADDFTCGSEYRFAVAATLSGGKFSGTSVYSSPVIYGQRGNCHKGENSGPMAMTSTLLLLFTVVSTFYSFI